MCNMRAVCTCWDVCTSVYECVCPANVCEYMSVCMEMGKLNYI